MKEKSPASSLLQLTCVFNTCILGIGDTELTYGELKRLLKKNGCFFHHQGSRHEMWKNPETGKLFPVGRHNTEEVPKGTLKSIKSDAGFK